METTMASRDLIGPGLVLLFCVSQAFRDVYFGNVFQGVDFFAVILLAFVASTVIFTAIPLIRDVAAFAKLRGQAGDVIAANFFTAMAWSCYFFALTHLEPSVVNTLHSGMAPLTVIALGAFGVRLAKAEPIGWAEYFGYCGIAIAMIALGWVVLSGHSGFAADQDGFALLGLTALLVSGASITISLLYCKRMQDRGASADVVTSVRYLLLILIAGGVISHKGGLTGVGSASEAVILATVATVLIVLPLYAFQVGIGLTAPLTAQVLRALGPMFVFALQQIDGRLSYSAPTLVCILAYSAAAILSNLAHARSATQAPLISAKRRPWRPEAAPRRS
jgi:hypothetical protein